MIPKFRPRAVFLAILAAGGILVLVVAGIHQHYRQAEANRRMEEDQVYRVWMHDQTEVLRRVRGKTGWTPLFDEAVEDTYVLIAATGLETHDAIRLLVTIEKEMPTATHDEKMKMAKECGLAWIGFVVWREEHGSTGSLSRDERRFDAWIKAQPSKASKCPVP